MKNFFALDRLIEERENARTPYLEFLRVPALSAGIYHLAPGSLDPQKPHHEDEVYYVIRGRGRMRVEGEEREVTAGSIIFVQAQLEHRFYDIEEELLILVLFAPAESPLAASPT